MVIYMDRSSTQTTMVLPIINKKILKLARFFSIFTSDYLIQKLSFSYLPNNDRVKSIKWSWEVWLHYLKKLTQRPCRGIVWHTFTKYMSQKANRCAILHTTCSRILDCVLKGASYVGGILRPMVFSSTVQRASCRQRWNMILPWERLECL